MHEVYEKLNQGEMVIITEGDVRIYLKLEETCLIISSVVFEDDYIPHSVRGYIARQTEPISRLFISMNVHIERYSTKVILEGLVSSNILTNNMLTKTINEFIVTTRNWCITLADQARKDLMYIAVR